MGRKRKYASDEECRQAALRRLWLKNLPEQLENARKRHLHVVRTLRREGMDELLTDVERGWE